nr:MAG TPA: Protein of unknown function (DUF2443) [Caudoviricetes sp.]
MLSMANYTQKHVESIKKAIQSIERAKKNTRLLFCRVLTLSL